MWPMVDGDLEKGFKLLNKKHNLDEAFPQRTAFAEGEFMLLCRIMPIFYG